MLVAFGDQLLGIVVHGLADGTDARGVDLVLLISGQHIPKAADQAFDVLGLLEVVLLQPPAGPGVHLAQRLDEHLSNDLKKGIDVLCRAYFTGEPLALKRAQVAIASLLWTQAFRSPSAYYEELARTSEHRHDEL